jgi:hypothetical protein
MQYGLKISTPISILRQVVHSYNLHLLACLLVATKVLMHSMPLEWDRGIDILRRPIGGKPLQNVLESQEEDCTIAYAIRMQSLNFHYQKVVPIARIRMPSYIV